MNNHIIFQLDTELFTIEKWKAFKGKFPSGSNVEHRIIIVYKDSGIMKYFYVTSKVEVLGEVPEGIRRCIISAVCASISFTEAEKAKYTI